MRGISSLLTLASRLLCSALLTNEIFYSPQGVVAGIAISNDSFPQNSGIREAKSTDLLQNLTSFRNNCGEPSSTSLSTLPYSYIRMTLAGSNATTYYSS